MGFWQPEKLVLFFDIAWAQGRSLAPQIRLRPVQIYTHASEVHFWILLCHFAFCILIFALLLLCHFALEFLLQVVASSIGDSLSTVFQVELVEDAAEMGSDRAFADKEPIGNLDVG